MKNLSKSFAILSLIAISLYACTDDYFEFDKIKTDDWRPELAVPLINSTLSLEDILIREDSNGVITSNPDGVLEITYEGRVFSTTGEKAITLPRQDFDETVSFPGGVPPSPTGGSLPYDTSYTLSFDDNGAGFEVDNILLKQGDLVFTIENRYQHRILLKATFKTFKDDNGDSLVLNYNIPPAQAGGVSVRSVITDLDGYNLGMNEDAMGNPAINKIPVELEFVFELTPGVGSSAGENIKILGALQNLDFKEFTGNLGTQPLELDKDTILINLFKNFKNGEIFLSNPFLDITILNSYAVPMNMNFQDLTAINPPETKTIILPQNPIALSSPAKYGVGDTNIVLDNTNSNIDEIISFFLEEIAYDAVAQPNPDGPPPSNRRNFITDTSSIGLDVELRLPFEGRASGFSLVDTIDFDFEASSELDNGLVRVRTRNGFPVEVEFQIIFTDSLYNPIDSLYESGQRSLIAPAITDANGDVIRQVDEQQDVEIAGGRLQKLSDGKFALIRAELNTTGANSQENVRFRSSYSLDIALGLKASILID